MENNELINDETANNPEESLDVPAGNEGDATIGEGIHEEAGDADLVSDTPPVDESPADSEPEVPEEATKIPEIEAIEGIIETIRAKEQTYADVAAIQACRHAVNKLLEAAQLVQKVLG